MAVKLSTGLVQFLTGEGSLRKAFEDSILNIYSGTAPTTADAIPTGTLLCKLTKSSGAVVTTSRTDRSVPEVRKYLMSGTHAAGSSVSVTVTLADASTATYTYTIHTTSASLRTTTATAREFARMINDIPQLSALATPGATTAVGRIITIQSRIAGLSFHVVQKTSLGPTISTAGTLITTASRANTLQLGIPVAGIISKSSDTWSGVNLATGVAGYFRLVAPGDTATLSTTEVRVQGTCATSGAELNMSNTTLTISATTTIDTFAVTLPLLV